MNHSTEHAERETVPRLLFGRHHGYDLREQWISKGLLALAHAENAPARARLFAFPEASDRFGLGPGMVAALRYWLRTTGLMIEQQPGSAHGRLVPTLTPLGALLARYDPYLEQVGSLWLLHAHLTTNLLLAPTFYWFFQSFVGTLPFTKEACLDALLSWAIKDAPGQHINSDVLRKDLECLFRLYTSGSRAPQASPEQSLIASPFRRLRLLQCLPPPESGSLAGKPTRRDLPRYVLYPSSDG